MRLPIEVQALLAPVLSLVEAGAGLRNRATPLWVPDRRMDEHKRQRLWLGGRFQTLPEDQIDRFVGGRASSVSRGLPCGGSRRVFTTSMGLAIYEACCALAERYLIWRSSSLCVRAGMMEELHELDSFFPVNHVVRACQARLTNDGYLHSAQALLLPSSVPELDTEHVRLSAIAARGMADVHLHLGGVANSTQTWALALFDPAYLERARVRDENDAVAVHVARILAQALLAHLLMSASGRPQDTGVFRQVLATCEDLLLGATTRELRLIRIGKVRASVLELLARLGQESSPADRSWLDEHDLSILRQVATTLPLAGERLDLLTGLLRVDRHAGPSLAAEELLLRWFHLVLHRAVDRVSSALLAGPGASRPRIGLQDRRTSEWGLAPGTLVARHDAAGSLMPLLAAYVTCHTWHHLMATQHGVRPGLRRFKAYYDSPHRRLGLSRESFSKRILEHLFTEHHVGLVEGRVTPPKADGLDRYRPWVSAYGEWLARGPGRGHQPVPEPIRSSLGPGGAPDPMPGPGSAGPWGAAAGEPSFGLVIHFIKCQPGPDAAARGYGLARFHHARSMAGREALRLFRYLCSGSPFAAFICGIDAANEELAVPPEVFAPAFSFLRAIPYSVPPQGMGRHDLVRLVQRVRPPGEVRDRLRATYHVGEDFIHLLSGLRRIDEAMELLDLRHGDRLGHAIALGIDPEAWMRGWSSEIHVSKLEWLDNMVWLLLTLGPGHDLVGEVGLELMIARLAQEIYASTGSSSDRVAGADPTSGRDGLENALSPVVLHHAWMLRQLDPRGLDVVRHAFETPPGAFSPERSRWWRAQHLVADRLKLCRMSRSAFQVHLAYLYDRRVQEIGEELDAVPLGRPWPQIISEAQDAMQRKVHEKGLVVEVNPSSNLRISAMDRVCDHHVFRLTDPEVGGVSIPVTVNTDDPGVFRTSLSHELILIGESLLRDREWSEAEVERWLDEVRRRAWERTFLPSDASSSLDELRRFARGWWHTGQSLRARSSRRYLGL
jgi:hypothetical protein